MVNDQGPGSQKTRETRLLLEEAENEIDRGNYGDAAELLLDVAEAARQAAQIYKLR